MSLFAPLLIVCALLAGTIRGVDVYEALLSGARKGLDVLLQILPALLVLFPAVYLLRASGLPEGLARLLAPALERLGVPPETTLLMLLRPLSGSAALSAGGGDAGLQRDHLLCGGGVSLRRRGEAQPLGDPGGAAGGPGVLSLLRLGLPAAVGIRE